MKFVLIFGPQAVGKMTVGQELEKITDLKLFHNHATLELIHPYFGFGEETWRLSDLFREELFKAVAGSDLKGLIFTYVWAFDQQEDWDFVRKSCDIFEAAGGTVHFVELEAPVEERLDRNRTPNRLEHKPTKRDIGKSEQNLLETLEKHRLNSFPGEIRQEHYLRIDNTSLGAEEAARMIKEKMELL